MSKLIKEYIHIGNSFDGKKAILICKKDKTYILKPVKQYKPRVNCECSMFYFEPFINFTKPENRLLIDGKDGLPTLNPNYKK